MVGGLALLFFLTGWTPSTAWAAFEDRGPVPSANGVGGLHAGDALSFPSRSLNPSAGSWRTGWGFHAAWSDPFGIPELSQARIDASGPLGNRWTLGLWGMGLGGAAYSERSSGVTLSRSFGATLAVGLGLSRSVVNLDRYGGDSQISLDLGLTYRHRLFDAGLAADNLLQSRLERFGETSNHPFIAAGISLPLDEGSRLLLDYQWDESGHTAVRAGMELRIYGPIQLRAGWDGGTERLSIGFGIGLGGWRTDSAWDHHPYLGWTPSAGMQWERDHDPLP